MTKYTDSAENFNLIQANEQAPISKRNVGILAMVWNRMGLPDFLHEFATAILVAGNWDRTDEFDEISLMRLARAMTAHENDQLRVYNRLKKNSPKFFIWQEKQPFTIIERIILREQATWHKTKAKYKFLLYPLIESLWNLPKKTTQAALRRAVDEALKEYPVVEKPKRRGRKRKPEASVSAAARNLLDAGEDTGSPEAAGLYFSEADEVISQGEYFERLLGITLKNIRLKRGLLSNIER